MISPIRLILFASLLLSVSIIHSAEQNRQILIIKSGEANVYNEVIEYIKGHLHTNCSKQKNSCTDPGIHSFISSEAKPTDKEYDIVISLGLKAKQYADQYFTHSNRIDAMIPSGYGGLSISADNQRESCTIVLDQPVSRSLSLISQLIPYARRIGVLLSWSDEHFIQQLRRESEDAGFILVSSLVESTSEIGRKLAPLLNNVDALLALPDTRIHNRKTVSNILLSSYRKKVPLFGFSAAYVNAGAIAAVYATPKDIGKHLAETLENYFKSGVIKPITEYPKYYSVSINRQVVRSLDIQLPADSGVMEQLIREKE